jgi:hypothetical protein
MLKSPIPLTALGGRAEEAARPPSCSRKTSGVRVWGTKSSGGKVRLRDLLNRVDQISRRKWLPQVSYASCLQGGFFGRVVVGPCDEYHRNC